LGLDPHETVALSPILAPLLDGGSLAPTEYGRRPFCCSLHDRRFCAKNRAERGWWSRNGDHGARVSVHREEWASSQPIQTAWRYGMLRTVANGAGDVVGAPTNGDLVRQHAISIL
jgi:hypothetical protein